MFRKSAAISAGLHAAVLLWALVSFSGKTFESKPMDSLPVDLINDKDFSELTKGTKQAPKVETPKPVVEKIAEPKPAETPAANVAEKKEVQPTEQNPPEPATQAKPDPIADKIKKTEDPKQEAKVEPKLPPKKPPEKQTPKFDADKIQALLDKREATRAAATGDTLYDKPSLGRALATATRLSISEKEAFRRRITECWTPPVGLDSAQELVVVFRVIFNQDGTVKQGPDVIGGKPSQFGPAFAESARRAILQCQPYTMLRKETYAEWQDMELAFNPSDMFK